MLARSSPSARWPLIAAPSAPHSTNWRRFLLRFFGQIMRSRGFENNMFSSGPFYRYVALIRQFSLWLRTCSWLGAMSSVSSFDFSEAWAWAGWTASSERISGGAIDAGGSLLLVGNLGHEVIEYDDDTFVDPVAGDFAAVKLLSSGEVLWTWTDSSWGSYFDSWYAVDTDSNNDVSTVVERTCTGGGKFFCFRVAPMLLPIDGTPNSFFIPLDTAKETIRCATPCYPIATELYVLQVIIGGITEGYWADWNFDETWHMAVVKLDGSTGDELWRYQESPPDYTTTAVFGYYSYSGHTSVLGVAVDSDDNVFLVGQVYGSLEIGEGDPGDSDAYVMKVRSRSRNVRVEYASWGMT